MSPQSSRAFFIFEYALILYFQFHQLLVRRILVILLLQTRHKTGLSPTQQADQSETKVIISKSYY